MCITKCFIDEFLESPHLQSYNLSHIVGYHIEYHSKTIKNNKISWLIKVYIKNSTICDDIFLLYNTDTKYYSLCLDPGYTYWNPYKYLTKEIYHFLKHNEECKLDKSSSETEMISSKICDYVLIAAFGIPLNILKTIKGSNFYVQISDCNL